MSLEQCRWLLLLALVAVGARGTRAAAPQREHALIESDVQRFASQLELWLDAEQRPCDDFHAYVCGRRANTSATAASGPEQRQQEQQQRFDAFLARDNNAQLLDAERKLKHFHESCRAARAPEQLRSSLLYRSSGGWPAIDDTPAMLRKRHNVTWLGMLGAFHEAGVEYFFEHRVEIKSNRRLVHLQPNAELRYSLRRFEQRAGEVLQEYAVDAGRARLVALEILSFERSRRELLNAEASPPEAAHQCSYASFKGSLAAGAQRLKWDAYFRKILGKPLQPNDTMVLQQRSQLVALFELLQNTSTTRLLNWIWIDYLMDKSAGDCRALAQLHFAPVYEHIVRRSAMDRVQMAQLYADVGSAYDALLPATPWIDEMSQQNSRQLLGRILHLTLNGDASLDAEYAALNITRRNFYRNLEKMQRFRLQRRRATPSGATPANPAASEFMQLFVTLDALLQLGNLSAPLNYLLVGERFAEALIVGGSSSRTPGAWRSMESERQFASLRRCVASGADSGGYDLNVLLQRLLAQRIAWRALHKWLDAQQQPLLQRINQVLAAAGRQQLSLERVYFIAATLSDCYSPGYNALLRDYLRHSQDFSQAFDCRTGDALYASSDCAVLSST